MNAPSTGRPALSAATRRILARVAIVLVVTAVAYVMRDRSEESVSSPSAGTRAAKPTGEWESPFGKSNRNADGSKAERPFDTSEDADDSREARTELAEAKPAGVPKDLPTGEPVANPARKTGADSAPRPGEKPASGSPSTGPKSESGSSAKSTPKADAENSSQFLVKNVTIRDQSDRVVYRGEVNLAPTLERIRKGIRNEHRNDGSTFQNREKRLPKRSEGYYKEYVHPTPGVSGPGPQRIILGKEGEVYYTSDHYRSFKRLK